MAVPDLYVFGDITHPSPYSFSPAVWKISGGVVTLLHKSSKTGCRFGTGHINNGYIFASSAYLRTFGRNAVSYMKPDQTWVDLDPPADADTTNWEGGGVTGIWGVSDTEIYIVGSKNSSDPIKPYGSAAWRWNGSAWIALAFPLDWLLVGPGTEPQSLGVGDFSFLQNEPGRLIHSSAGVLSDGGKPGITNQVVGYMMNTSSEMFIADAYGHAIALAGGVWTSKWFPVLPGPFMGQLAGTGYDAIYGHVNPLGFPNSSGKLIGKYNWNTNTYATVHTYSGSKVRECFIIHPSTNEIVCISSSGAVIHSADGSAWTEDDLNANFSATITPGDFALPYGILAAASSPPPTPVERPSYDISQIISPENGDGDFGSCTAADGDWLVVGNGGSGSNKVLVYKRNAWGQYDHHQNLDNVPVWATIPPVEFGASVAISGNYIAVADPGAPASFPTVPGANGWVHSWKYSPGLDLWVHHQGFGEWEIPGRHGNLVAMAYGYAVIIDSLAIEPSSSEVRGSWSAYRRDEDDAWRLEQRAYGALLNAGYGASLHISQDNQFWVSYPCGSGIARIERWDYNPSAEDPAPKWTIGQVIVAPTEAGQWGGASVDAFFLSSTHSELLVTDPANGQIYVHELPSGLPQAETLKLVEPPGVSPEYSTEEVGNISIFDPHGVADRFAVSGKYCAFTFNRVGSRWIFNGPIRVHAQARVGWGKDGLVFVDDGTLVVGSLEEAPGQIRGYVFQCSRSWSRITVEQPANNTDLGHWQNASADGEWAILGQPNPRGISEISPGAVQVLKRTGSDYAVHSVLEGPPSELWVCFQPPSGGIFYSQDKERDSWDQQSSDPIWIGTGKMYGIDPTRIVANVGYYDSGPPIVGHPIAAFNGTVWTLDEDLDVPWTKTSGIWCSSDEILITCHKDVPGDRTWRRKATGAWSIVETLAANNWYEDLSGVSNSAVFACGGDSGTNGHWVRKWDGAVVTQVYTSAVAGFPRAIFALAEDKIWYAWEDAATGNVVIEFWDGISWTEQYNTSHGGFAVTAMWAFDDTHVWAICGGEAVGPVLFFDGAWAPQVLPDITGTTLAEIFGTSDRDVYITGIGTGRLLVFNGTDWVDDTPAGWDVEAPVGLFAEMIVSYGTSVHMKGEKIIISEPDAGVGRLYLYEYVIGTDSWDLVTRIDSDISSAVIESFGTGIRIDEAGTTIAVTGFLADNSHRVQIFFDSGGWALQQEVFIPGYKDDITIALVNDALALATPLDGSGVVYFYKRAAGVWDLKQQISSVSGEANDQFGYSMDMSGVVLVISSAQAGPKPGRLYIYHPDWLDESLLLKGTFEDPNNVPYSSGAYGLGEHVAINGGLVVCGDSVCFRDNETDGSTIDRGGRGLIVGWNGTKWRALGSVAQRWSECGQLNFGFSVATDNRRVLVCVPNEFAVDASVVYGWEYGSDDVSLDLNFSIGPIIGPNPNPYGDFISRPSIRVISEDMIRIEFDVDMATDRNLVNAANYAITRTNDQDREITVLRAQGVQNVGSTRFVDLVITAPTPGATYILYADNLVKVDGEPVTDLKSSFVAHKTKGDSVLEGVPTSFSVSEAAVLQHVLLAISTEDDRIGGNDNLIALSKV